MWERFHPSPLVKLEFQNERLKMISLFDGKAQEIEGFHIKMALGVSDG